MGTYAGGSYWDSVTSTYDHTPGTERPTWARGLGAAALKVMIQSSGILYSTTQARCGPAQAAALNLPPAEGRQMTPCNERICVVCDQNIAKNLTVLIENPQPGLRPLGAPARQAG